MGPASGVGSSDALKAEVQAKFTVTIGEAAKTVCLDIEKHESGAYAA